MTQRITNRVLDLAERIDRDHRGPIVKALRAAIHDPWDGRPGIDRTHRVRVRSLTRHDLAVSVVITYDIGPHANDGWFPQANLDRCWHLQIVGELKTGGRVNPVLADLDPEEVTAWALAIFGTDVALAWNQPPASTGPQHIWHTRLYMDRNMRPIVPEGEVHTLVPFYDAPAPDKAART